MLQEALVAAGVSGVFRPYYDLEQLGANMTPQLKRAWDRNVPSQVAQLFARRGVVNATRRVLADENVTCIDSIEAQPADARTSVGVGWHSTTRLGNTLADIALSSKNAKLRDYRRDNGTYFREYWLAIASLGPGVVEDGGFSMLVARRFQSDFDRVFLIIHNGGGRYDRADEITPNRLP